MAGVSASYARNGLGLVTAITDPRGRVWQSTYDAQGRRTGRTDPLASSTTMAYDSRSRASVITFPGGLGNATLTYDARGRLLEHGYSDGTRLQYTWDADDRLTGAADASPLTGGAGITLTWDDGGRIVECNGLTMTYDGGGLLTSVTLGPGKTVSYTYDARGLVTGVTDWVGGTTTLGHDAAGRVTSIARPNGITTSFTHDADGRLVSIEEGALGAISVTRDGRGRITQATRDLPLLAAPPVGSRELAFDAACQVASHSHDALGRLLDDGVRTYAWDLASRLVSYVEQGAAVAFEWDAFGNLSAREDASGTRRMVWNYALGLPSVALERADTGANEGTAADLRYHVHTPDGGTLLHTVEAVDGSRRFYHYDEMGNTVFLTADAGTLVAAYAYDPYGVILAESGAVENRFTFQGRFGVMREGSLYLHRVRFYDPGTGRFLSRDPVQGIDPQRINPYQAFFGNPLLYVDPRGTDGEENGSAAGASKPWYERFVDWVTGATEEAQEMRDRAASESAARDKRAKERHARAAQGQGQAPGSGAAPAQGGAPASGTAPAQGQPASGVRQLPCACEPYLGPHSKGTPIGCKYFPAGPQPSPLYIGPEPTPLEPPTKGPAPSLPDPAPPGCPWEGEPFPYPTRPGCEGADGGDPSSFTWEPVSFLMDDECHDPTPHCYCGDLACPGGRTAGGPR
jgi:RHS repeat-associated protein